MSFLHNTIFALFGNIATGVISLLVAVFVARTLGPDGKGAVTLLILVPTFAAMSLDLGISIANVYFAKYREVPRDILFSSSLFWAVSVGLVAIFSVICGLHMWPSLADGITPNAAVVASFTTPLFLLLYVMRPLLLASDHVIDFSVSNALQPLLLMIAALLIFAVSGASVLNMLWAYVASLLILCIHVGWRLRPRQFCLRLDVIRQAIKFGIIGHIGTLIQQCIFRLDVLILASLTGSREVGIYSIAYVCAEVLLRLPRAIGTILFPTVSGLEGNAAETLTAAVFKGMNVILVVAGGCLGAIGYCFIPDVFGVNFSDARLPFLLLIPGVFFFSWNNVFIESLKGEGKVQYKLYTAVVGLVVLICLDFLLIPRYGIAGAALASSIAYGSSGIFALVIYCRLRKRRLIDLVCPDRSDFVFFTNAARRLVFGLRGGH